MIGFGSPGVYLDTILQRDHQEFNTFVFDDTEMHRSLQIANVNPSITTFHLLNGKTKSRHYSMPHFLPLTSTKVMKLY